MNSRATFEAIQIAGRRLVCNTVCQGLTSARRSKFGTYRYHSDGEMVEVRTPDGRHKITQRDGSSTTSLASLLLGELALQRVRGGWWRRRQRGGIEQNVSTCGNIEKVISLSPIHIIR